MNDDTVVALIKELTARLSAAAAEIGSRPAQGGADPGSGDGRGLGQRMALARSLIEQRRLRRRFLPPELFHEPAWDMLLALYLAWHESRVMNVKTLVGASDAPVTTSQRWIDHLAKLSLVTRVVDPADRRRIEVSLSQSGLEAIDRYLGALP